MDSAQKLICKSLGNLASWKSVLNWQRRGTPFHKVGEENIQLMHDGINHWLLSFNSNGRVQVCDSLYETLGSVTKRCLKALYKSLLDKDGKLSVTMIPVQKQKDYSISDYLQLRLRQIFWKGFYLPSLNSMSLPSERICQNVLRSNSFLLSRKIQSEHDVQYQVKDLGFSKSETT